ncbi:hypothetical protein ACET3Z_026823 [Daucus carota]
MDNLLEDQVAVALRRLSSGESLLTVAYSFQIHKATVGNITWSFVEVIEQNGIHYIQWPSTETKMTPCGHSFCLKCFQRWVVQGNYTCAKCHRSIPPKMASQPRIKSSLVSVIRMAKMSISRSMHGPPKYHQYVHNQDRPDKAYTTEWAKKSGMANAASGWIHVTTPPDHFGPILPERKMGVLVGE